MNPSFGCSLCIRIRQGIVLVLSILGISCLFGIFLCGCVCIVLGCNIRQSFFHCLVKVYVEIIDVYISSMNIHAWMS